MGQVLGYKRVSSESQTTDRQDLGQCDVVFDEKISGKSKDRPELAAMLKHARAEDTVVVHSIDRLARSLQDLQEIVDELVDKGVTVKFLKENLTFSHGSENATGRLMLQVLGSIAEFERTLIRSRQKEGIERAKRQGKYEGRKPKIEASKIVDCWEWNRSLSLKEIAKREGCSVSSVHRILSKYEPYQKYEGKNLTPQERAQAKLGSGKY